MMRRAVVIPSKGRAVFSREVPQKTPMGTEALEKLLPTFTIWTLGTWTNIWIWCEVCAKNNPCQGLQVSSQVQHIRDSSLKTSKRNSLK